MSVPQGIIIGSLVYINELSAVVISSILMTNFADDTNFLFFKENYIRIEQNYGCAVDRDKKN